MWQRVERGTGLHHDTAYSVVPHVAESRTRDWVAPRHGVQRGASCGRESNEGLGCTTTRRTAWCLMWQRVERGTGLHHDTAYSVVPHVAESRTRDWVAPRHGVQRGASCGRESNEGLGCTTTRRTAWCLMWQRVERGTGLHHDTAYSVVPHVAESRTRDWVAPRHGVQRGASCGRESNEGLGCTTTRRTAWCLMWQRVERGTGLHHDTAYSVVPHVAESRTRDWVAPRHGVQRGASCGRESNEGLGCTTTRRTAWCLMWQRVERGTGLHHDTAYSVVPHVAESRTRDWVAPRHGVQRGASCGRESNEGLGCTTTRRTAWCLMWQRVERGTGLHHDTAYSVVPHVAESRTRDWVAPRHGVQRGASCGRESNEGLGCTTTRRTAWCLMWQRVERGTGLHHDTAYSVVPHVAESRTRDWVAPRHGVQRGASCGRESNEGLGCTTTRRTAWCLMWQRVERGTGLHHDTAYSVVPHVAESRTRDWVAPRHGVQRGASCGRESNEGLGCTTTRRTAWCLMWQRVERGTGLHHDTAYSVVPHVAESRTRDWVAPRHGVQRGASCGRESNEGLGCTTTRRTAWCLMWQRVERGTGLHHDTAYSVVPHVAESRTRDWVAPRHGVQRGASCGRESNEGLGCTTTRRTAWCLMWQRVERGTGLHHDTAYSVVPHVAESRTRDWVAPRHGVQRGASCGRESNEGLGCTTTRRTAWCLMWQRVERGTGLHHDTAYSVVPHVAESRTRDWVAPRHGVQRGASCGRESNEGLGCTTTRRTAWCLMWQRVERGTGLHHDTAYSVVPHVAESRTRDWVAPRHGVQRGASCGRESNEGLGCTTTRRTAWCLMWQRIERGTGLHPDTAYSVVPHVAESRTRDWVAPRHGVQRGASCGRESNEGPGCTRTQRTAWCLMWQRVERGIGLHTGYSVVPHVAESRTRDRVAPRHSVQRSASCGRESIERPGFTLTMAYSVVPHVT
ncbi:UNVERIFIED_CONTAM: hypothetical protein FKN15_001648 [Acipenser sinensis]